MAEEAIFIDSKDMVILKKALAQILYQKNFDQSRLSSLLDISQPMVSNYCKSKDEIPDNVLKTAMDIAERILAGQSVIFRTCVSFSDEPLEGSFFIAGKNELINDENNEIVNNLTEAFLLLKERDISGLIPEVKINIAMAKEKPSGSDDVAAFLNGLIVADGRVIGYNGIRFGKSRHLSSLLLSLKSILDVNAIMNIAYVEDIGKTGFTYGFLTKDYKLRDKLKQVDVLLHEGDFGIEPCAYVLGKNAVDVVNKVLKIKEEIYDEVGR